MRITKFEIKNFRSLRNFAVKELGPTSIFYGENNAGKSNILNALQLIFRRKPQYTSDFSFTNPINFYQGYIQNSQNNYFKNDYTNPIRFDIEVEVFRDELDINPSIKKLFPDRANSKFQIVGSIYVQNIDDPRLSVCKVEKIRLNNKVDIYLSNGSKFTYFPSLDKNESKQAELENAFTRLIDPLNDCVYIVPSDRDMHDSTIKNEDFNDVSPKSFKNFLYELYLSDRRHHLFEKIDDIFSKEPFKFGNISFLKEKDSDALDIMIKERDFRLPIKHLGSGVLQTLYIITCIIYSKSKILCVEELEQNLSPKNQYLTLKKLQSMLGDRKDNVVNQLILSSHSSVYSKPKLGVIYYIEKNNGETAINPREINKLSRKIKEHLSHTQLQYSEKEFQEVQDILAKEHDFYFGMEKPKKK